MDRTLVVEDQDLMRLVLIAEMKASVGDCLVMGAQTFQKTVKTRQARWSVDGYPRWQA
ncbi:hypothetical protein [Phyllobacterium salinisoli]|nr:hypothetical protein [Phyllobacterium salinisoli]